MQGQLFMPIVILIRFLLPYVITISLFIAFPQRMIVYAIEMFKKGEYIWLLLPVFGVPLSIYLGFLYIRRQWGFDAFPYLKRGFKGIGEGGKALFALIYKTEETGYKKSYKPDNKSNGKQPNSAPKIPITLYEAKGKENRHIELRNPYRGIFVVGANGSGKSESVAIPLLKEFIKNDFNGLIYDFKFPTLAKEVEHFKGVENSQKPHYYVDFTNPLNSYRVNPIAPEYLLNTTYAREFSSAIITNLMKESIQKPDIWSRSATDILTACMWYLKTHHPERCDLPHVFAMITSNSERLIQTLAQDEITQQMTVSIFDAMVRGAENQVAGVMGTLQSTIAQINTPEFMYIFGANDFSLDLNKRENGSIVTIGNNPTTPSSIAPLASLIMTVATKMMNQPDKEKSFFLFDEMPTCYVPNIEILPNTGRSNKIATIFMIQDIAQLNDGYGQQKADVIFAACNNHFYGRIATSKTAEILSKQLGKEDRTFTTRSSNTGNNMNAGGGGFNQGQSTGESIQERDIMRPAEFLHLKTGEFVAILTESNWKYIRMKMKYFGGEREPWKPIQQEGDIYGYFRSVKRFVNDNILTKEEEAEKTHENGLKKEIEPTAAEPEEETPTEAPTETPTEAPPPIEENEIEKYFRELRESQNNSSL